MKKLLSYGIVLLLMLIYINSFFTRQIIAVLGVDIREAFMLGNLQIGLLYGTAFSVIYAFAGIPMGRLADKTSRKWMIIAGLFVWSLMTLLSGFATSFLFLIIARLLVGLSQAMLSPAVYSYLADLFPADKRATVFSVYAGGIFIGVGLSFIAGGTVAQSYDWQTALIWAGIPGLLLVPVAAWLIREPARIMPERSDFSHNMLSEISLILRKPAVRYHLIGFAALACTGYTILAFAGIIFNDVFGRNDLTSHYGWFILFVSLSVMISGKFADYLAAKNSARRFYAGYIAAIGGLPFYAIGFFSSSAELALWMMGIGVLISSSYNGVAAALIQYFVYNHQRALAGGLYLFVISIAGFGLGPPLTGWLMDSVFTGTYAASKAVFSVMIVCSTVAVISFAFAMKHYKNDAVTDPNSY